MIKSLWHSITDLFCGFADKQQTKEESDAELALKALSHTRLFPHDPSNPVEQRVALRKALAFLGHPKSRKTGGAMNGDEAMGLLDTIEPWRRVHCTPYFSAETLELAHKEGDEYAFWAYIKELEAPHRKTGNPSLSP